MYWPFPFYHQHQRSQVDSLEYKYCTMSHTIYTWNVREENALFSSIYSYPVTATALQNRHAEISLSKARKGPWQAGHSTALSSALPCADTWRRNSRMQPTPAVGYLVSNQCGWKKTASNHRHSWSEVSHTNPHRAPCPMRFQFEPPPPAATSLPVLKLRGADWLVERTSAGWAHQLPVIYGPSFRIKLIQTSSWSTLDETWS